jgi:hypothetical protein
MGGRGGGVYDVMLREGRGGVRLVDELWAMRIVEWYEEKVGARMISRLLDSRNDLDHMLSPEALLSPKGDFRYLASSVTVRDKSSDADSHDDEVKRQGTILSHNILAAQRNKMKVPRDPDAVP